MHGIAIVPAPVTETTVTFVAHSSIELNDETVGGEFHVDPDRHLDSVQHTSHLPVYRHRDLHPTRQRVEQPCRDCSGPVAEGRP